MTQLRDPYSQMFPPRFPSGLDIHRVFQRAVTEAEWLKHKLHGIDAWFSKNPLFIFTAAYRLDFQKISSTLHGTSGVLSADSGQHVIAVEQSVSHLPFRRIPGTSAFYKQHRSDIETKAEAVGHPMFFFTITNLRCPPGYGTFSGRAGRVSQS